jgi:hypothetical protein
MRHAGFHDHPWPKSKKFDPLARLRLEKTVAKNPAAGAFKLKVCAFLCLFIFFPYSDCYF